MEPIRVRGRYKAFSGIGPKYAATLSSSRVGFRTILVLSRALFALGIQIGGCVQRIVVLETSAVCHWIQSHTPTIIGLVVLGRVLVSTGVVLGEC